jgi:hypothetical protein
MSCDPPTSATRNDVVQVADHGRKRNNAVLLKSYPAELFDQVEAAVIGASAQPLRSGK